MRLWSHIVWLFCGFVMGFVGEAFASDWYVNASLDESSVPADGLTTATAFPTIQSALEQASSHPGTHTVYVAEGVYTGPVRINVPNLRMVGQWQVVLRSAGLGLGIAADGVIVDGFVLEGGEKWNPRVLIEGGRQVVLDNLSVRDQKGIGLLVRGAGTTATIEASQIDGSSRTGVLVESGARVILRNSTVSDGPGNLHTEALVMVTGKGSLLQVEHSAVLRGGRVCLFAGDSAELTITGSIVAGCGANITVQKQGYALLQDGSALLRVEDSIVDGMGSNPHSHTTRGDVIEGRGVQWNRYPGFAAWESALAAFAVTVDDGKNWDNAVALAEVMDEHDLELTYFMSSPERRDEEQWEALRSMVVEGHEIGCHSGTHPWLTLEHPLEIAWSGGVSAEDRAVVEIDEEGRFFSISSRKAGVVKIDVGPIDLWAPRSNNLAKLCKFVMRHPDYRCEVVKFEGRQNRAGVGSGLDSGKTELVSGQPQALAWDNRLPSEGGRHYFNEMVKPARSIEENIGNGYRVRSFAYPGQKHSETIRAAVQDSGYDIARGNGNHLGANQLLQGEINIFQSPVSLTVEQAKGPDFDSLDLAGQETRIRTFAHAWATHSLASNAMGALTIHGLATFSPQQLGWLMDEMATLPVKVMTVHEIYGLIVKHGASDDGMRWKLPSTQDLDFELAGHSQAVDVGLGTERARDMLGRPIYGLPDLGPLEYQPDKQVGADAFPVGIGARIYGDGKMRWLGVLQDHAEANGLTIRPDAGFAPYLPQEVRPALVDVVVESWSEVSRVWSMFEASMPFCVTIEGLKANHLYDLLGRSQEQEPMHAIVESDAEGRVSFLHPATVSDMEYELMRDGSHPVFRPMASVESCRPEPMASR